MKCLIKILLPLFVIVCSANNLSAIELDDVYRKLGKYNVVKAEGLRIFYPQRIELAMPRILHNFSNVRSSLNDEFPQQKGYEVNVILSEHDDLVDNSINRQFDWIELSIFEDNSLFSTMSYSLENRFAFQLAKIFLLRSISSSQESYWRRQIAMLSIPEWFMKGLALNYAFEMHPVHFCRILDKAISESLYTPTELNTIVSQPLLIKENMTFQAQSMVSFWQKHYSAKSGQEFLREASRIPGSFERTFRQHYGVSISEAFREYKKWMSQNIKCLNKPEIIKRDTQEAFYRSLIRLSDNEIIWVSSKRYSTENYDLYYQKNGDSPKLLLKNVHPLIYADKKSSTIYVARYMVNNLRQRRLSLWQITPEKNKRRLVSEQGSFKPLGKRFGRLFYVSAKKGITRIMSANIDFQNSTREEYTFPVSFNPGQISISEDCRTIYFTNNVGNNKTGLFTINLAEDQPAIYKLFATKHRINTLKKTENTLWLTAGSKESGLQLYKLDITRHTLKQLSDFSAGVWDLVITDTDVYAITLYDGDFYKSLIKNTANYDTKKLLQEPKEFIPETLSPVQGSRYKSEFRTAYWTPIFSEDEDGRVLGIYNFRTDRLDRNSIVLAPRYGFKSKNLGYKGSYMHRFGLLKSQFTILDNVRKTKYLDNDYYERIRSRSFELLYPLELATTISWGIDFSERSIAKIPSANFPLPTVGRDHFVFAEIRHKAIRTEPYWQILPRKGRRINAGYHRGTSLLDSELIYDSMFIDWEEYIEVGTNMVLTTRFNAAQDDKQNNIRRPNDIALGKYMRSLDRSAYPGDQLRKVSFHLGLPLNFQYPQFMTWFQNEFMVAEVFWEAGDTKINDSFDYKYGRGVELRTQTLFMSRLPLTVRFGQAWQNGGSSSNTWISIEGSELTEFFR